MMEIRSVPICIRCFRKLHGPERVPARLNDAGMAALEHSSRSPCHFCERSTDAVPGIFIRAWAPLEPEDDRWWQRES